MNAMWKQLDAACFAHLKPMPEPQIVPADQEAAEQFASDVLEAVSAIADETARWARWVDEGRRSMPALNAGEREALLVDLWAKHATIKSMRSGEL